MTVENQIPSQSFTANGTQSAFAFNFYVEGKDNIEVQQNGNMVSANNYKYEQTTNSILFNIVPKAGDTIEIKRVTSIDRSIQYATYDNSFRPEVLNYDLDRIIRILQELGFISTVLAARLAKEILDRTKGDQLLQDQILQEVEQRLKTDKYLQEQITSNDFDISVLFIGLKQEIKDRIQGDRDVARDARDYTDFMLKMNNSSNIFDGIADNIVITENGDSQRQVNKKVKNILEQVIDEQTGLVKDLSVLTWSGRTQDAKNLDTVHVEDFRNFLGVILDDQDTMVRAIKYCKENKRTLSWEGSALVSTGNLVDFWDIQNIGLGTITKGKDVFHITPTGSDLNIQYVAASNAYTANDGMSSSTPIAIGSIMHRVERIARHTLDGQWRFQFLSGKFNSNGMRWNNIPTFRNSLQFYGQEVDHYSKISTVWVCPKGSNVYAFRVENSSPSVQAEFKYLRFEDWEQSGNAGAILCWNPCRILVDYCSFIRCSMGAAIRYGYLRVINSYFEDTKTWGVSSAYHATANVGNLIGGGNVFVRSNVNTGRNAVTYIQGNDFHESTIACSRVSRIRTQGNTYHSWTGALIDMSLGSTYTPDNDAGSPDIFVQTPSIDNPVYRSTNGSTHLHLQAGTGDVHLSSHTLVQLDNPEKDKVHMLSSTESSWVPFRIPAYVMYSHVRLSVEVLVRVGAEQGGTLELFGQGSANTARMASISLPVDTVTQDYRILFEYWGITDSSGAVSVSCPKLGIETARTLNVSSSAFRDKSEVRKLFRFYYTPSTDTGTIYFRKFVSKIEV